MTALHITIQRDEKDNVVIHRININNLAREDATLDEIVAANTFETALVELLKPMKADGYEFTNIPQRGEDHT